MLHELVPAGSALLSLPEERDMTMEWKIEDGELKFRNYDGNWEFAQSDEAAAILTHAIAEERERCAKIADDRAERCRLYALEVGSDVLAQRERVAEVECKWLADAIRSTKDTGGK